MKYLTTIILLLFVSCGIKPQDVEKTNELRYKLDTDNSIFDTYQLYFENDYYINTGKTIDTSWIRINFDADLEGTTKNGVCYSFSDGKREITIRETAWNLMSEYSRKHLIYHELGHCALNLEHDDTMYGGFKLNIMHPNAINSLHFEFFEVEYVKGLFENDNQHMIEAIDALSGN